MPVKKMPSYPQRLIAGEKYPPQLASPQVPVSGDLPATIHLPVKRLPVPVSRPETNPSALSGPRGFAFSGIRSERTFTASPIPERYCSYTVAGTIRSSITPEPRSTSRILPMSPCAMRICSPFVVALC